MSLIASPLWKRLDTPGHDACTVAQAADAWVLEGACAFAEPGGATALTYRVECDAGWITRRARIEGVRAGAAVEHEIARSSGGTWTLDAQPAPAVEGCLDIDFGFTPATNFLQLSREAMGVGERRAFEVAWWEFGELTRLLQSYRRLTETTYQYDSSQGGFSAVLEMGPDGFVTHYPTLWAAEGHPASR